MSKKLSLTCIKVLERSSQLTGNVTCDPACRSHIMFACLYHIRTMHSHNQISLTLPSFSPFCPHMRPCPFRCTVSSCPLLVCLTSRRRDRSHSSLPACIQHTREIRLCLLALFALSLPSLGHVLSVTCPAAAAAATSNKARIV